VRTGFFIKMMFYLMKIIHPREYFFYFSKVWEGISEKKMITCLLTFYGYPHRLERIKLTVYSLSIKLYVQNRVILYIKFS